MGKRKIDMDTNEKIAFIERFTLLKREKELGAHPNTWEWVENIRKEIQTDTDNYPWRRACEELWSAVSHFQNDEFLSIGRNDISGNHPIESLSDWLWLAL